MRKPVYVVHELNTCNNTVIVLTILFCECNKVEMAHPKILIRIKYGYGILKSISVTKKAVRVFFSVDWYELDGKKTIIFFNTYILILLHAIIFAAFHFNL